MEQIIISKSMNTCFEKGKVLSKFVMKPCIMLTTIRGIYDNGKIILTEEPPVKTKADVMVTFLPTEESKATPGKQKIILGLLEGKIKLPDDFNEPLDDLKEYM